MLANIPGLKVSARTSAFFFKGKQVPMGDIAKQLDVAYVVEGSVRKSANRVRITAQLIKAADGFHVWSEEFDRELKDIFEVQDEIAGLIARNLSLKLHLVSENAPSRGGTANPEAYDLFLRGRELWNKRTGPDLVNAVGYFQQATQKDPQFALAFAGLGSCYVLLPAYAEVSAWGALRNARAAANRAVDLEPRLAEAHAVLALCLDWECNDTAAERSYRHALALNPNYATAHHWYGWFLANVGRPDEGLVEIHLAQTLDPLSVILQTDAAKILCQSRKYDEAVRQLDKALGFSKNFPAAHRLRGLARIGQKNLTEAVAEFEKARALGGNDPELCGYMGYSYAASGRTNEAQQEIEHLKSNATNGLLVATSIALVFQGLGARDQVFAWLDRAASNPLEGVPRLQFDPLWDDVTADPRYAALLRKQGSKQ